MGQQSNVCASLSKLTVHKAIAGGAEPSIGCSTTPYVRKILASCTLELTPKETLIDVGVFLWVPSFIFLLKGIMGGKAQGSRPSGSCPEGLLGLRQKLVPSTSLALTSSGARAFLAATRVSCSSFSKFSPRIGLRPRDLRTRPVASRQHLDRRGVKALARLCCNPPSLTRLPLARYLIAFSAIRALVFQSAPPPPRPTLVVASTI